MSHATVANPANLQLLEAAYQAWRRDPSSVDPSWRYFFEGFELGLARPAAAALPADGATPTRTAVIRLIYAYRQQGHFLAHLDPLSEPRTRHPQLELAEVGLSDADLDRPVDTAPFLGLASPSPLRDLLKALRETYCRSIGAEYYHIQDSYIRHWLQQRMEPRRNQ